MEKARAVKQTNLIPFLKAPTKPISAHLLTAYAYKHYIYKIVEKYPHQNFEANMTMYAIITL
jgi:hypothetical protein